MTAPFVLYMAPYPPHCDTVDDVMVHVLSPRAHTPLFHVSWTVHVSMSTCECLSSTTPRASRPGEEMSQPTILPELDKH